MASKLHKSNKDIKHKEFNIYKELKSIKTFQISKNGNNFEKYFRNRCIRGFLQRRVIQKEINRKIKGYEFDSLVSPSKGSVTEELTKLFPENQDWNNVSVINSQKNQEFIELMNQYLYKKKNEVMTQSKSAKNLSRLQSPSSHRKYEVSPELLRYLHKMKNKIPPSCLYNPNYNAISPHVPYTKLKPLRIKNDSLRKERKSSSVTTKSNVVTKINNNNYNNNNTNNINIESCKNNRINIKPFENNPSHVMSFEKYSSRNAIFTKAKYKDTILEPLKLSRKVSSPIFKNMSPRYKNKMVTRMPVLVYLNPNYDMIYNGSYRSRPMDDKASCRAKAIRKIWSSFNATSDYQSVPNF